MADKATDANAGATGAQNKHVRRPKDPYKAVHRHVTAGLLILLIIGLAAWAVF